MNMNDVIDQSLTIQKEMFEKTAGLKLGESIDNWDKEIIKHIHETLPYITGQPYEIKFKNMDRKYGYAVGSIQFTNLKTAYIPIVIKKYEASPLDILVSNEEAQPLTEETFQNASAEQTPLGKLVDPFQTQQLVERQNAQANDLTDYPVAKYGFLQKACGDREPLKKIARANMLVVADYKKNGTLELLKQAMSVPAKPDVVYANEKVIGRDITNIDSGPYTSLDKTAVCRVATIDNKFHEGVLIRNVYDLDLEKQAFSLFISDDGCYGYQDKFAGVYRKEESLTKLASLKNDNYGVGDDICLVSKTASACMATLPIKIDSKSIVDGYTKIAGHTVNGEAVELYFTPGLKSITKVGHVYHIPAGKMEITKLGNARRFHWNTDSVKYQSIGKYASNTTRLVNNGSMLTVENEFIKNAGQMLPAEAYEILKNYYTNPIDMIKTACHKGSAIFTGVKFGLTKVAEKFSFKTDIEENFKIAATLTDPDAVDAVLSLGYINEANLQDFIEAIPEFDSVINHLAKLLLAIRLGLKGDEYAVKRAMESMQSAVDILKGLKG